MYLYVKKLGIIFALNYTDLHGYTNFLIPLLPALRIQGFVEVLFVFNIKSEYRNPDPS